MDTITGLFFVVSLVLAWTVALIVGALIAKYVFGADLNEPEYYEHKERDNVRRNRR